MNRHAISLVTLLSILACPLAAQRPDSLPAGSDSVRTVPRLGPVVVTGSATPAPAAGLGLAITVIDDSTITARQPQYAHGVFRGLTGTFVDEAVGPGGPTILRIRGGEEVFTQILMDGVSINQNGGFFDLQGLTLTNVERVEIVRGPQSALYGSSAVSGAVQFLTRQGSPGAPRIAGNLEGVTGGDPSGSFRSEARVSGGSDQIRYAVGGGLSYNRGIFDVAHDTWTRDASLRLDASPGTRWDVVGLVRYMDIESNLPVRDPGATRVPLDPNARDERRRLVSSLSASFRPSDAWEHRLRGSLYREEFRYLDEFDDVASTGPYDFFIFDANFTLDSRLWRSGLDYQGSFRLKPSATVSRLLLSYGGRIEREDLRDVTAGDFGDGTLELARTAGAGYVEAQIDLGDRTSILAGARVEKFGALSPEITPRIAARVDVVPNRISLRGSVGRAYKAPNLQQQYQDNPFIVSNPDLTAETSVSWEAGVGVTPSRGIDISGTFFRQGFDDLIQLVPSGMDERAMYRNLSAARALGVEVGATVLAGGAWRIGGEGAWIATKVIDNAGLAESAFPVDSALPFRPTVTGSGFVEWAPSGRFSILARTRIVGSQIVLSERFSGRRVEIDPYALLAAYVRYRMTAVLEIYARAENILNTAYATGYDRPGMPRTVAMGFRIGN